MENDTIRKRWPDLGRERLMTDAQVRTQAARTIIAKIVCWSKDMLCERCKKHLAVSTERYCINCKLIVIEELIDCGYLQKSGMNHCGQGRTEEMKEDIFETKYGTEAGTGVYNALH